MATNTGAKAISGNAIRHGSCVVGRPLAATSTPTLTSAVRGKGWPTIEKIDAKYNNRFNHPRYYTSNN